MMTSLFSSFDPCSMFPVFTMWISSFILFILLPSKWWLINSRTSIQYFNILKILHFELKMLMGNSSQGNTLLFISLMFLIAMNNVLGLFPYIFTSTSHLVMALSLAAPLWISFMIFGWFNNMKHMFAHMVPTSTPNLLMPFMVLIETISNIIRPGTLTVRLSANMIAGHLLLTLLGNQTTYSSSYFMVYIMLLMQILLLLLESAVAIIQAYVFTVLSTLYSAEVINN